MKLISMILAFIGSRALTFGVKEMNPVGVVEGFVLIMIALGVYTYAMRRDQAVRDRQIRELAEDIDNGKDRLFYFYLRPFAITSKLPVPNPKYKSGGFQHIVHPDQYLDLEHIIERALTATGINFLALGRPGEAVGAGRILTTEENWKDRFEVYATSAAGILVIPSVHPGTLWELSRLVGGNYCGKTVFIQPSKYCESDWEEIRRAVAAFGLYLPAHSHGGQMFKILPSGELACTRLPGFFDSRQSDGVSIQCLRMATAPLNQDSHGAKKRVPALGRIKLGYRARTVIYAIAGFLLLWFLVAATAIWLGGR